VRDIILIWRVWNVKNTRYWYFFLLNERIYLFWKQTISHLIKSLKNVRKSNINYCKCTIEKVHETNRMLKPNIWYTRWRKTKRKTQHNMCCTPLCANKHNVNKTWAHLKTTGGKDEPNIVFKKCKKKQYQLL
jgi:hypothetical protein